MITAILEKRVARLEAEIRQIKSTLPAVSRPSQIDTTSAAFKKLPRGIQAGLRDIVAGRTSGPFDTVDELMAHLEKR